MKRRLSSLAVILCICGVASNALASREIVLEHTEGNQIVVSGAGAGLPVETLQSLTFALEYDPDLLEIHELAEGHVLFNHPPDQLQIDYLPGRVEVLLSYETPPVLDSTPGVTNALFFVNGGGRLWYEGEKVRIRTVGRLPGEPPRWIDDEAHPDDIKVVVVDRVIVGDSGVTCLAGDALGDGAIDAGDASAVLRIDAGIVEAPDVMTRCGADFNQDGYIHAGDGVLILRRAAGFDDSALRLEIAPRVTLVPTATGARVRIEDAGFAHGATVRVNSVGAVTLRGIESSSTALAARRADDDEAVIALAGVMPLSGDVLEFEIEAEGVGRIAIGQLSLYGANGDALFEQDDPLAIDLTGPPVMPSLALGNTPNPFNPSTTFWMELPREGRVVLELYDMRGRKQAKLLDEVRSAGRSEYRFDAQSMPSGVYFARLTTDFGATVHRITLLK